MLLKIAEPLADETTSKRILKEVIKADTNLISGIKACTKQITAIESNKSIFVINGTTQPADLVMHLPALCEEHSIPYIFVEDSKWIGNKTCVFLNDIGDEKYTKIFKHCQTKPE